MKHAYANLEHVCSYTCMRTYTLGFYWPLFSKNRFLLIKSYIFHFNTSQVNLTSDWALNQPWALEFGHHWGAGAWVVKGTKCSVNRCPFFDSWVLFQCMARAQPTHTTHIMHTWGGVQLQRVAWDLYVRIPTFVAREMSNDKFTILEPVLPISSKRRVTHYPRVT